MRESFVFYKSFFDAICKLDDKKRLKMFDLITNFALNEEEIDTKYEICEQLFILIKPQLMASQKHYEDGKKGGRPKKIKNPPFEKIKSNVNVNDNVNVNVNDNVNLNLNENVCEKEKTDPQFSPLKEFFLDEFEKITGKRPRLSYQDGIKLIELENENPDLKELIPEAIEKLKEIEFTDINFKPSANWLLKDNNFVRVLNGEFEKVSTTTYHDEMEEAAERYFAKKKAQLEGENG